MTIRRFSNDIYLLADGVVAACIVVCSVLLPGDELLRMEHLAVSPGSHLVDHRRLKVDKDSTRDVLAGARLGEEGVEGIVGDADGLVGGHLTVGLDPVLQAVELPASIAHLATCLAHVDGDAFPLRIEVHFTFSSDILPTILMIL